MIIKYPRPIADVVLISVPGTRPRRDLIDKVSISLGRLPHPLFPFDCHVLHLVCLPPTRVCLLLGLSLSLGRLPYSLFLRRLVYPVPSPSVHRCTLSPLVHCCTLTPILPWLVWHCWAGVVVGVRRRPIVVVGFCFCYLALLVQHC